MTIKPYFCILYAIIKIKFDHLFTQEKNMFTGGKWKLSYVINDKRKSLFVLVIF